MKRILLVFAMLLSVMIMTGCDPDIYIEPNTISVVYENPRFIGTTFYIDVFITNGYDNDEFVGYMEFDIYADDDAIYVAGAGFDIDETIKADDYVMIELEFGSEYVFATEEELNDAGYELEDLELFFWLDE